jgi:5'-nucleotidase (lipoprotein e(P4) family)
MKKFLPLIFIAAIISCRVSQPIAQHSASQLVVNGKIWTSLYQQKAAEYQALCYQAYNVAKLRLDAALQTSGNKPLAVVTDIDETMLDNSPYAVHQALRGKDYDAATWYEWTAKGTAEPLCGANTFFNYAASKGVVVFYITNRDEKERTGTLANLRKYNFPYADNEHLILKQAQSSKESRRQTVADKYDIVLLLGDNLADFSTLWDKKATDERSRNVELNKEEFGKKYIVLPNANYGGWEDAIYNNSYKLAPSQKDSALRANLKGY